MKQFKMGKEKNQISDDSIRWDKKRIKTSEDSIRRDERV